MKRTLRMTTAAALATLALGSMLCWNGVAAADDTNGTAPGQPASPPVTPRNGSRPPSPAVSSPGALPQKGQAGQPASQLRQAATPGGEAKATQPPIITVKDDKIDADIEGRPLNEALRAMVEKKLFDIRGPMPAGGEITARFSGLTLDEALKKLMRGYNYVLLDQGASQKPVLVLIGKIQRGAASEQPAQPVQAQPPASEPPAPGQATAAPVPPPQGQVNSVPRPNSRGYPRANPEGGLATAAPVAPTPASQQPPQEAQANGQPPAVQAASPAAPPIGGAEGQAPPGQQPPQPQQGPPGQGQQPTQGGAGGTNGGNAPNNSPPNGESTGVSF